MRYRSGMLLVGMLSIRLLGDSAFSVVCSWLAGSKHKGPVDTTQSTCFNLCQTIIEITRCRARM